MVLEKLEIERFRHLNNIKFEFGKVLTVIAGGNGTGKTSILGLIGHIFKYDSQNKNFFNKRFETKYSDVFRFSEKYDKESDLKYRLSINEGKNSLMSSKVIPGVLRISVENNKERHRIDVGERKTNAGKLNYPVIFLSLKRLIPLAQEGDIKYNNQRLSEELSEKYNIIYNEIFIIPENITPIETVSKNKHSYSPTTSKYDSLGISAGQDNIGQIILALLSFYNLKNLEKEKYSGGVLLIDELDATLYPAVQVNLVKTLFKYGVLLNLQIVFTTHSSDILNFLASNDSSHLKMRSNFVCLSNANGPVIVQEGHKNLNILLADLNHTVISMIKPKTINFYFEDKEGCLFYKNIIDDEKVISEFEFCFKELSLGCGNYGTLISSGFEEFFKSIVVLDGDSSVREASDNTVVNLPGIIRPENVISNFLSSLEENDLFWDNDRRYTKRVFLQRFKDKKSQNRERDTMKLWFNKEIEFMGENNQSRLFKRWKELNRSEVNNVVNRTNFVLDIINNNYFRNIIK